MLKKKSKLFLLFASAFFSVSLPLISSVSCDSNNQNIYQQILEQNIKKFKNQKTTNRNFNVENIRKKNIEEFYQLSSLDNDIKISFFGLEPDYQKGEISFRIKLEKENEFLDSKLILISNFLTEQECNKELAKLQETFFVSKDLASINQNNINEIIPLINLAKDFSLNYTIIKNLQNTNEIKAIAKLKYKNESIKLEKDFSKEISILQSPAVNPNTEEIFAWYNLFKNKTTKNPKIDPNSIKKENLDLVYDIPLLAENVSANYSSFIVSEDKTSLNFDVQLLWKNTNIGSAKNITISGFKPQTKPNDQEILEYYSLFKNKTTKNPKIDPNSIKEINLASVYDIPLLPENISAKYSSFSVAEDKTSLNFDVQLLWKNTNIGSHKNILISGFKPQTKPPINSGYDEHGFKILTQEDKNYKLDRRLLNKISRDQIPYNVSEEQLNKAVSLPTNQETIKWFLDIEKNNDEGYIDLKVIRRDLIFSREYGERSSDALSRTTALDSLRLTGFKKMSTKDIVAERTVSMFLGTEKWYTYGNRTEPTFDEYINGLPAPNGNPWRSKFERIGTGFVLDKAKNKPIYYIATNKHVLNANDILWMNNTNNQNGNNSVFDQLFNKENYQNLNLRGLISFGSQVDAPLSGYDERLSPFDVKKRPQETIKEINIISDFSKIFGPEQVTNFSNLNKAYNSLNQANEYYEFPNDETQLNPHSKVALDMVILRVEYVNEQASPFYSWWNQRPTRVRIPDERDMFNFDNYWDKDEGSSTPFTYSNTRKSYDSFDVDKPTEFGNVRLKNTIYTAGYPGFRTYNDWKNKKRNLYLSFKEGVSYISNESRELDIGRYNYWSTQGTITYDKNVEINQGGASGSPVFDKNLNLIGILWGGTNFESAGLNGATGNYGNANSFSYFGTNFATDYLGYVYDYINDPNKLINMLNDTSFEIPNYDYIHGNKNGTYSYKSSLDTYCPNDGPTYLLPNRR